MDYTKINKLNPPAHNFWNDILDMIKDVTPWASIVAIVFKTINEYVKWITKNRDIKLAEIVEDRIADTVNPKIDRLSTSIDELKESIWALKNKI